MRQAVAAVLALGWAAPAAADFCGTRGAQTIFHCKIDGSSREVTVCRHEDDSFHYAYGRPGQTPELEMRHAKERVAYTPWNGVGKSFWADLEFRNAAFGYMVAYSVPKERPNDVYGVLIVSENGEEIARKACKPGTVLTRLDELEGLF